jgi:hypothetical protein
MKRDQYHIYFVILYTEKCKQHFVIQPFQNPPLSSSTIRTALIPEQLSDRTAFRPEQLSAQNSYQTRTAFRSEQLSDQTAFRPDLVDSEQECYLKGCRAVHDDLGGVPECATGLVLALSGDDLGPGLPGGLGLGGHGPLQLLRYPHVLHLHPLHLHTPRVRRLVQGRLQQEDFINPVSRIFSLGRDSWIFYTCFLSPFLTSINSVHETGIYFLHLSGPIDKFSHNFC